MTQRFTIFLLLLVSLLFLVGCDCGKKDEDTKNTDKGSIVLATTTSTYNSGLLDVLNEAFTKESGIGVKVVAKGTGAALKLAENGDADVVMVHARGREDAFVAEGFGVNRRDLMYNDFVILGPPADPAKIRGTSKAAEALSKIAAGKASFCSRNDESGTHIREKELWAASKVQPEGKWYLKVNKGMGATLIHTDEIQGYTLCDRGTYLAYRFGRREKSGPVELDVLVEGDAILRNPYGVIAVNPAKHKHAKYLNAMRYIAFLTSPAGQKLIGDFRVNGKLLFHPSAGIGL